MRHIHRRTFLQFAGGGLFAASGEASPTVPAIPSKEDTVDIEALPNFCAHEHWGSFAAIGSDTEGFRADTEAGAVPRRSVSIWDLVLDPYLGGWIASTGVHWDEMAKAAGAKDFLAWWRENPHAALDSMRPHLERQQFTGAFQCIQRGIQFLHGIDVGSMNAAEWLRAETAIASAYQDLFGWYAQAVKKANFTGVARPVHPEFYYRTGDINAAARERTFTHTLLRIDPLLEFWHRASPRRDALAQRFGVEPSDASRWRNFLDRLFTDARQHGALGIKQLQAYHRPLDFAPRKDSEIKFIGALTPDQISAFQDWLVHECCIRAQDLGWPHQVHVGTHNLMQSSPLPLEALAKRYDKVKFVLLHCWPFLDEAGWLAKHVPNIFIDTCWQNVLNPAFFRESLDHWLHYVPLHKIMCSHDATSIEMAAGSAMFTREILAERLNASIGPALDARHAAAKSLLNGNAALVYGIA